MVLFFRPLLLSGSLFVTQSEHERVALSYCKAVQKRDGEENLKILCLL